MDNSLLNVRRTIFHEDRLRIKELPGNIWRDGKKADTNRTILINEQGIIQDIGKSDDLSVPSNYETVDISGKYVMPGLINAHVHLFADGKPFSLSVSEGMLNFAYHHILDTKIGRSVLKKRMKKRHYCTSRWCNNDAQCWRIFLSGCSLKG